MKRLLTLSIVAAAVLALPSAANAASIYNYRVHDAGSVIVERYRLCIGSTPGYEVRVTDRTRVEQYDGGDSHRYNGVGWYDRGCHVVRNSFPDELAYEGTYYARLRVRIGTTGQVLYSGWRSFYSS
jgi:hypothetical protein